MAEVFDRLKAALSHPSCWGLRGGQISTEHQDRQKDVPAPVAIVIPQQQTPQYDACRTTRPGDGNVARSQGVAMLASQISQSRVSTSIKRKESTAARGTKERLSVLRVSLSFAVAAVFIACAGETIRGPPAVASVVVTPESSTLVSLGEAVQLTAEAYDASGNAIANVSLMWSSSNEDCATVSPSALVTAVANGLVTITATVDGVSGSASVTVQQEVASVAITPSGAAISGAGVTQAFAAEALDANGNLMSSEAVSWRSLNTAVATIDAATGAATAVASGQVTIAAEVAGVIGYALLTVSVPGLGAVSSWTFDLTPQPHLYGIWGSSPSDVFAVGEWGTILHFDGIEWTEMESGLEGCWDLAGAWGTSASDVYAVGRCGNIVHYDGSAWSAMSSGTSAYLRGVWGTSSSDIYAVADGGAILHYDGSAWSAMSSGTSAYLRGVWGTSSSDIYAVGTEGTVLHYDGAEWNPMPTGLVGPIIGVWGMSSDDVYAMSEYGSTILHYDGSSWITMAGGFGDQLEGVWGTSSSNIFAVGGWGRILRHDGSSWTEMPTSTGTYLHGVWGISPNDVYVAEGGGGAILH
ncbi:Ig-like domain-containing protein [Gemmatimonadota bacterium]